MAPIRGPTFLAALFKKLLLDNPIKKFFNSAIATPPNPCVYNKFSMKKLFKKAFSSKTIKNNYVYLHYY
ncbi:hypothetical protein CKX96_01970 [Staphylococcus argenteus]|nr:hypothetical protein CJ017_08635 [Staphylococcus argenteus]ATZ87536.1 hypothetical protein CKO49_08650 [Staphylococcus argenteus]KAA0801041.1 hypothetical protein DVU64_06065 [Staphylococcus argenteus]MZG25226.1 hypothetical protein [Staphylococcus argenteus]PSH08800.1 hypothetical protein CKX96_01970 [Staphylococcus argenteus]